MKHTPELIVMLTHNDITVPDAAAVFARCQHTRARYWGFKEEGLPFAEMQALFAQMKACGKTTCLEVIAYTEPECLHGAEMAAACGCDILMVRSTLTPSMLIAAPMGCGICPSLGKFLAVPLSCTAPRRG